MAFDRRKMKTAQEQDKIDESNKNRRQLTKRESTMLLATVLGIAASSTPAAILKRNSKDRF